MVTPNEIDQVIAHIAERLAEHEAKPVATISRIVRKFGVDFALQALDDTLQVESQGGMMVNDESRKRTPGGVFFYLVRGRISKKDIYAIFQTHQAHKERKESSPPFAWNDRLIVARELAEQKGEAKVKVTLIGRPGKVVEKRDFAMIMIRDSKVPPLPKGLPTPPENPTSYMVYISKKQWNRVKETLQNPEDILIIEGFARYDPELEGVAVFATNTTSKFLQQQQRQAQQ